MFARLWSNRKPNATSNRHQPRRFRPALEQLDDRILPSISPMAGLTPPSDGFQGVSGQSRTFTLTAAPGDAGVPVGGYDFTIDWMDTFSKPLPQY